MATGERRGGRSGLGRPAEDIEVTLFRQILLVPFAIEPVDGDAARLTGGAQRLQALAERLPSTWREITLERWRHLPEDEGATGEGLADAYAEFVYFEPYAQRFLFGAKCEGVGDAPVRLWRRSDIGAVDVSVRRSKDRPIERYRLKVERLNLYGFDTGNVILALEVAFAPELAVWLDQGDRPWPNLSGILTLIERFRRICPPYFAHRDTSGRKIDHLAAPLFPVSLNWVVGDANQHRFDFTPDSSMTAVDGVRLIEDERVPPMHPKWRKLIEGLPLDGYRDSYKGSAVRLSQLGDDRAFSLVILGVEDVATIGEADWVRLTMCDEPGDGTPYARPFLADWQAQHAYDRFFDPSAGLTTRHLASAYSYAMVGTAKRPNDSGFCYFRDILAGHGRRHYFQLCLIAYFQKIALLTLSERLAEAMRPSRAEARSLPHDIEGDILRFTHGYWFESLSAQIQAQEIFELLRRNLRLRELYAQVRQEVREADAFAASAEQRDLGQSAQRLNVIAAVGLAASVIVGFFGMNVFTPGDAFLTADLPFFRGMVIAMVGLFGTLFVLRDRLIKAFSAEAVGYLNLFLLGALVTMFGIGALLRPAVVP